MCIFCKPGEEGEIIGTIRSDDRGGPENFEVVLLIWIYFAKSLHT